MANQSDLENIANRIGVAVNGADPLVLRERIVRYVQALQAEKLEWLQYGERVEAEKREKG